MPNDDALKVCVHVRRWICVPILVLVAPFSKRAAEFLVRALHGVYVPRRCTHGA